LSFIAPPGIILAKILQTIFYLKGEAHEKAVMILEAVSARR
jgi:hypothetical protein